jgi:arylsulfatase A-like enzyme
MIRTDKWKYVHFKGLPPQLFDLENDPDEFNDLGRADGYETVREALHRKLTDRLIDRKNRVAMSDETVLAMRAGESSSGIIIGVWEPSA